MEGKAKEEYSIFAYCLCTSDNGLFKPFMESDDTEALLQSVKMIMVLETSHQFITYSNDRMLWFIIKSLHNPLIIHLYSLYFNLTQWHEYNIQ